MALQQKFTPLNLLSIGIKLKQLAEVKNDVELWQLLKCSILSCSISFL
jgi:hypothetical protein